MATRYFVITGRSLVESSRCWFPEGDTKRREFDQNLAKLGKSTDECDLKDLYILTDHQQNLILQARSFPTILGDSAAEVRKMAVKLANRFDPHCWSMDKRKLLPAELATLLMLNRHAGDLRISNTNDHIIFLGGKDSKDQSTLPLAYLLQAVLHRILNEDIRDGGHPLKFKPENIGVHHEDFIWNPSNSAVFETQMEKLMGMIKRDRGSDNVALVLTGGYKAIGQRLAFWLGGNRKLNATLYYLHEDSDELIFMRTEDLRDRQEYDHAG